jgi:hypothetical protein
MLGAKVTRDAFVESMPQAVALAETSTKVLKHVVVPDI